MQQANDGFEASAALTWLFIALFLAGDAICFLWRKKVAVVLIVAAISAIAASI